MRTVSRSPKNPKKRGTFILKDRVSVTNTRSDSDDATVVVAKRIARRLIDSATGISILRNERLCIAPCYQFFWGDRSPKYFSTRINVEGDVKYWEIIANNLKKRGSSLGWVSAVDTEGRTIWIADAHRDGKRFIVRADEKLTAFLELERGDLRVR
jgi:hypothetical protein